MWSSVVDLTSGLDAGAIWVPRPSGRWVGLKGFSQLYRLLCCVYTDRDIPDWLWFVSSHDNSRLIKFLYILCGPFETAGRSCSKEMTLFPSQQSYLRGIKFKGTGTGVCGAGKVSARPENQWDKRPIADTELPVCFLLPDLVFAVILSEWLHESTALCILGGREQKGWIQDPGAQNEIAGCRHQ